MRWKADPNDVSKEEVEEGFSSVEEGIELSFVSLKANMLISPELTAY